jgi:hypothetical protein
MSLVAAFPEWMSAGMWDHVAFYERVGAVVASRLAFPETFAAVL